jgi:hypothetical protein
MLLQENDHQDPSLCIAFVSPNFQDADKLHKYLPPSFARTLIGGASLPSSVPKLSLTVVNNPDISTQFFHQNHASLPSFKGLPELVTKNPPFLLGFASKSFPTKLTEQFIQRADFAFQSTPKVVGVCSDYAFLGNQTHSTGLAGCSINGLNVDSFKKIVSTTFGNELLQAFHYNPYAGAGLFQPTKKLLMIQPPVLPTKPLALPASSASTTTDAAETTAMSSAVPAAPAPAVDVISVTAAGVQALPQVLPTESSVVTNKLRVPIVHLYEGYVFPRQSVDRPLLLTEPRYRRLCWQDLG